MRTFLSAIVAAFLTVMPIAVLADYSYTLTVPMTASNLPAGATVQVGCFLYSGPHGTSSNLARGFSQVATPTNGRYSGNLTVVMSTPTKAASYSCMVQVLLNGQVINYQTFGQPAPAAGWSGTMETTASLP